jgi:two-component system CheB/CheR fusion protein
VAEVELAGGPPGVTHASVELTPLLQEGGAVMGVLVSYTDISQAKKLEHDLQATGEELETALEELQSTNEELETTNEELQSTNEELETTNEELQSTNEELETMNEELESTNEELQAVNEEARRTTDELDEASSFMESILGGLGSAVVVLDADLRVSMWNRAAEDLWGVRSEEARGKPLMSLDIGLPVDELMSTLQHCLSGAGAREQTEVEATNRRGRKIRCLVSCSPLMGSGDRVQGAILLIDDRSPAPAGRR